MMGKYLALWEIDTTKMPVDPKERGAVFGTLMEMVGQDLQKGTLKDWGAFVGENNGYGVAEGTEVEIGKMNQQYAPFVRFKVHPVSSVDQVGEVIKSLLE